MKLYKLIALLFFITGISFLFYGIILNEVNVGFLLIFPFMIASGPFSIFGVFFIFISILFFSLDFLKRIKDETSISSGNLKEENFKKRSIKSRGIILIGPIPIIIGSNWKLSILIIIVASIALFLLFRI